MDSPTPTRSRTLAAAGLLLVLIATLLSQHLVGGSASAATAKASGGGPTLTIAHRTFQMTQPNDGTRFEVLCPKGKYPYGGGIQTSPVPDFDGEGIYPHSYERLGVQHGYHVTAILYDPKPNQTTPRNVTLQTACGPQLGNITPPHVTKTLNPGDTASLVARCPGARYLVGGGFQRTNFTNFGGVVATESRAISSKAWRVTGHAEPKFGGEMTAIAYCKQSKKPFLKTVSSSVTIPRKGFATATTPRCKPGRQLTFGGFSAPAASQVLMTNGGFTKKGTWRTAGYNRGADAVLRAYGYCMKIQA